MNKDENKMIEEMAKVLCDNDKRCEECIPRLLFTCGYKSYCTKLYNAGYRKVAEDEIVIKKSEYEALLLEQKRLKEMVDRIPCGYELKEITRQETVKDIINKIENLADIEIREDTACEKYFDMVLDILDKELED